MFVVIFKEKQKRNPVVLKTKSLVSHLQKGMSLQDQETVWLCKICTIYFQCKFRT